MLIKNLPDFFRHINVPNGDTKALVKAITFQAALPVNISVIPDTSLTNKVAFILQDTGNTDNSKRIRLSYPFADDDFWKAIDDGAEEILERDGLLEEDDLDVDDWLDSDDPWDY